MQHRSGTGPKGCKLETVWVPEWAGSRGLDRWYVSLRLAKKPPTCRLRHNGLQLSWTRKGGNGRLLTSLLDVSWIVTGVTYMRAPAHSRPTLLGHPRTCGDCL